jgi:hypothetical protein
MDAGVYYFGFIFRWGYMKHKKFKKKERFDLSMSKAQNNKGAI